ncbi:hypothetical protein FPV67DRAFT_1421941 [Lyophyllum atratum]|nr:hypothetical protein FPV67DRAFT_1421941 [Lyophyllum atratum]
MPWLPRLRTPANATGTSAPGTRELTAEQLAGTINGNAAPTTGSAANRTRRTRRPRRTPSQISTTSLPAYAKEPGEQELVIFRGPEDMEDAGMPPATVVMDPLEEDGEESLHSRNNSQSSHYPPVPATPIDEPLLEEDEYSADHSTHRMQPPGHDLPRRSLETLDSSEEASSLMRVDSNTPGYIDPRGEAPPYFEAVDITPESSNAQAETSALPTSASPPASSEPVPQRRSGFRTLLQSLPNRLSMHGSSHAPSHSRADSSFSMASSHNTHGRETSQSRASHRPTASGSGSFISLSPFRTLSRQKSQTNMNLTSPSLISLNSISSPLTHTLTRTEFTYPKAGPTPDQLKLISSRETFTRFAVPYGADAIAYAASTSRQDLDDVPPPDFDTPQLPSADNQATSGSAGPSRLRATSNAADLQQESASSSLESESVAPTTNVDVASTGTSSPSGSGPADADAASPPISPLRVPLPPSPKAPEVAPPAPAQTTPLALPKPSSQTLAPPSLRAPSVFEGRSESRASSVTSYATAAESMAPVDSFSDEELEEMATPTTPTMGARHVLEPTDATIKQSPGAAAGPSH